MENSMSEELKEYLLSHKYFLKQTLSTMLCLLNLPKCDKCGFGIIISIWVDGSYSIYTAERMWNITTYTPHLPNKIKTIEDAESVIRFYEKNHIW